MVRSLRSPAVTILVDLLCMRDMLQSPQHRPSLPAAPPQRFATLNPSSPEELVDRFNNGRNYTWLDEAIR